jgi:hypothetical protein
MTPSPEKKPRQLSPEEEEFLAPDGTWGVIVVVICTVGLALLFVIPTRDGGSPSSKFYLAGLTLLWMASGAKKIAEARAWRKLHKNEKT